MIPLGFDKAHKRIPETKFLLQRLQEIEDIEWLKPAHPTV